MKPIRTFAVSRRLGAGALLVAALLAGATPAGAQEATTASIAAATSAPERIEYPGDAVLYEASGRKWTVGEFVEAVRLYAPGPLGGLDIAEFDLSLPGADAVREAVKQTAIQDEAGRLAREQGIELEPARKDRLERDLQTVEQRVWLLQTGILDDAGVSEEEVRAEYDAKLEKSYTTPELLSMRHIYLGTYEAYDVQAGDSLESIAEKITGDGTAATRILDASTRLPRAEETTGADGAKLPPKALVEGEKLMVPMNAGKAEEVHARAKEAWERLQAGASFEEVAAEYGENPEPGRVMTLRPRAGEKPILAEMRAAFDGIEDGQHSAPFRTKHGWQIVRRESYKPPHVTPYESVREALRRNLVNAVREKRYTDLMEKLFAEYGDLKIDEDVLAHVEDPARKDDIVFQLVDLKYTAALFVRDMDGQFTEDTPVAERRRLLAKVSPIQKKLTEWDRERKKIRETPEFKRGAERAENIHLANRWLRKQLDDAKLEPTEEQLQSKFDEIKQMLRKAPTADVWQLTVKAPIPDDATLEQYQQAVDETASSLKEELAKVKTREDFVTLVKQMSEDEKASTDGHAGQQEEGYLGGMVGRAMAAETTGTVFGPETFPDGRVVALWIGGIDKGQNAELDAYRAETRSHVVREMEDKKTNELIEQIQKDIGLVIHVPPVAP